MIQKRKKWWKRGIAFGLTVCLAFFTFLYKEQIQTNATSLSELKKKQQEALQQQKKLEGEKKKLQDALGDMNSNMYKVSRELELVNDQIAEKETELSIAIEALEEAEEIAKQQYADMKSRIQYMYENQSAKSVLSELLESGSIAKLINRMEYVTELSNYDRRMLTDYQTTITQIAQTKSDIESEKAVLEQAKTTLAAKQTELNQLIKDKQAEVSVASNDLNQKQEENAQLEQKIKQMEEYERKLEEQKAREDAKRKEELKKQQATIDRNKVVEAEGEEMYLFANIIYCEAGGEPYEGQVAVASVILNRVRSSSFPNTITEVVYQKGQFSPVDSGRLALAMENNKATQSCYNAAKAALAGQNPIGDCLYFRMNNNLIDGTVIGNHVFY